MIDVNYKLRGMYRYSLYTQDELFYTSNWSRNTILSSGLIELYQKDIPSILNMLSLGQSNALPNSNGYGLSGVITPTSFINIPRSDFQSYIDNNTPSVKTYYTSFNITTSSTPITLREFAIMSTPTTGFARNVFQEEITVPGNSILNFEYKLEVDWEETQTTTTLIDNVSSNTFFIPISVTTYNIPGDKLFYSNTKLLLNQYNGSMPVFGEDFWKQNPNWGLTTKTNSTFNISQTLTAIDNITRKLTVTTLYNNISAPVYSGFNANINSFNLVLDGDTNIKNNSYFYCRFAYPLNLYNQVTVDSSTSYFQYNLLNLSLVHSWSEA